MYHDSIVNVYIACVCHAFCSSECFACVSKLVGLCVRGPTISLLCNQACCISLLDAGTSHVGLGQGSVGASF